MPSRRSVSGPAGEIFPRAAASTGMDRLELAGRIDHTTLGPKTTADDVKSVVSEASNHGMNACIPPCYIDVALETAHAVPLATVIGFPHGQHSPLSKRAEAVNAVTDGADELDIVANIGRLLGNEDDVVRADLAKVTDSVDVPVKVIVEAPLLTKSQLERACQCAVDADADMVKTSTGFVEGGATVKDVEIMSDFLPVKAAGGIGSWEQARRLFDAGAVRIGASAGVTIIENFSASDESTRD